MARNQRFSDSLLASNIVPLIKLDWRGDAPHYQYGKVGAVDAARGSPLRDVCHSFGWKSAETTPSSQATISSLACCLTSCKR